MEERKTISIKDLNIKELLDVDSKPADIPKDLPFQGPLKHRDWERAWI